jgi:hypothetical protein
VKSLSLAFVLVVALLGLSAESALAAPGDDATLTTTDVPLSFNSASAGTATCDGGAGATGGGVGVVNPLPLNLAINVSAPLDNTEVVGRTQTGDKPRAWHASEYSGAASNETARISAVCSSSAKVRLSVKTFKAASLKTTTATVSCPKGQRALGGGMDIATSPQDGLYEEASGPLPKHGDASSVATGDSPRRWMVAVYSGFGVKRTYRAVAICSANVRPKIVTAEATVGPNAFEENTAACPGGTLALGGGVLPLGRPRSDLQLVQNTPLGPDGTVAGTTDGQPPAFWDAEFLNRGDQPRDFNVLAVCG